MVKRRLHTEKILARPGLFPGSPSLSLAHLGLARSYMLMNDMENARREYGVLERWKNADADIPIYQAPALAEFEAGQLALRALRLTVSGWQQIIVARSAAAKLRSARQRHRHVHMV